MTDLQFQIVYDFISLTLACMMASTVFFWLRMASMPDQQKSALAVSGLVTFIASYHYYRIFNSWTEAYEYPAAIVDSNGSITISDPQPTGQPFNDGYRYMDWLITVPLLLMEVVLVMNLHPREAAIQTSKLGAAAALMIILGFPGEVAFNGSDVQYRWIFWALAMLPFVYIVFVMAVKLRSAVNKEKDENVRRLIQAAQWGTIASWTTYPIVYILPMCNIGDGSGRMSSNAVVAVQIGYSIADIIAKCGVGFLIYFVTSAKVKAQDGSNGAERLLNANNV